MNSLTDEERRQLGRLIALARRYRRTYGRRLRDLGAREVEVLFVIACEGPVSGAEIARRLGRERDRAGITRAAAELRGRRLVSDSSAADQRRMQLKATTAGLRVVREQIAERGPESTGPGFE
jgi:chromosome segregation and condensation protein ScpB